MSRASTLRGGLRSAVTLAGGAALAAVPAATVAIAARLFSPHEQGWIALAVMVSTFAGQLSFALVVESRLASSRTERRVVMPRWLTAAVVVAGAAAALTPPTAVVLCLALPVLLAGLEVGRGVSVAERLDRRELGASAAVGLGAVTGLAAALGGQRWALAPLAAGVVAATVVRARPVGHGASAPDRSARRWVLTDTAITGAVAPLLNAAILAHLSPLAAVLFTAVSTVSGLLSIPLNFMRLRLLKEHSGLDVAVSAAAVVGTVLVVLGLEVTGVLGWLFGDAWASGATVLPLLVACAWRAAALPTTLPFAELRRSGAVRLVTLLRAGISVLTVALALGGLAVRGLTGVFAGLVVAELLGALVLAVAARSRRAVSAR